VLDFYCEAIRLAVEVDGSGHGFGDRPERDARRDAWLAQCGIETLRIPAREVLNNMDGVYRGIAAQAAARANSLSCGKGGALRSSVTSCGVARQGRVGTIPAG